MALAQVLSLQQPARCAARMGACILHGSWLAAGNHRAWTWLAALAMARAIHSSPKYTGPQEQPGSVKDDQV